MKPCHVPKLPLSSLNWELFIDVLGKAHATIARFCLLLDRSAYPFLQAQEIKAQLPKERASYKKLLTFSFKAIRHQELSSTFLCTMHQFLKEGEFRKRQNWIGPKGCTKEEAYFLPPPYKKIPKAMENLKKYESRKEKDPLVHLAIYFAQLLIIHPFMDANGRLARAVVPLFLYKKGLTPMPYFYLSAYFRRRRLEYFEKLYLISKTKDWESWIRFFLEGIIEEGERIIRRYSSSSSSSSST